MPDPGRIGVVGHGESTGDLARAHAEATGLDVVDVPERDADVRLSPRGEEQARAVGRWLAEVPVDQRPDVVVRSPYLQALGAAWFASRELDRQPVRVVDERPRDRAAGILDLLTGRGVAPRTRTS